MEDDMASTSVFVFMLMVGSRTIQWIEKAWPLYEYGRACPAYVELAKYSEALLLYSRLRFGYFCSQGWSMYGWTRWPARRRAGGRTGEEVDLREGQRAALTPSYWYSTVVLQQGG